MKRKLARIIPFVLIILAGAGGYFMYVNRQQAPEDKLLLYGNVDIRQVQLAFQVSGRLEKIYVQEGDRVKAGTLLAEIDAVRYRANLQKAQAELAAQKQIVARLEAGSRPQEIEKARANVRAWEAKLINARITLHRLQSLSGLNYTARQKVDDAAAAYKAAKEELESARQALDLAIAGPRKEDIAAAVAKFRAAEAVVALAAKDLADTKIYAPADAVVRDRIMEPGDMAFPNFPALTLARTNPLWVRVYVPEPDLGKIAPGMQAAISTDSYPGKMYRGWIGYISPTAEFTPKNVETPALRTRLVYQVRVFACNPAGELRLGMPATVQVDLSQKKPEGPVNRQAGCQER